jgi:raffinose/stachyose/melibiose transport system substrate-binding protein
MLTLVAAGVVATASAIVAHGATGQEKIKLDVWMASGTPEETGVAALAKRFEAKHKNVDVTITYRSFADTIKTLPLKLAGNDAPDVVQGAQGYTLDATLVKRNLIVPLDQYAAQYGWTKLYGAAALGQYKLRPDGVWDGKTRLYGVGHHVDFVGVFYNKAKLRQLGFRTAPKTLAQFEAVLAKAAAAGERGYIFGNQDGISGTWVLGSMIGYYGNAAYVRNWLYGRSGTTWVNGPNRSATNKLKQWVDKGYVTEDFNGVAYPDSITAFAEGEGVFLVTGSWAASGVQAKLKNDVGFMNFPRGRTGKVQGIGSLSLPWHISRKSENQDLAAEFINTLVAKSSAPTLLRHGRIPGFASPVRTVSNALLRDIGVAWEQMRKDNGQLLYLDWSTTTMLTELERGIQEVLAGRISTNEFLVRIQKNWSDFQKAQKK